MPSATRGMGWVVALLVLSGRVARADPPKLDAQQLHPAATSSGYLGLENATVMPDMRIAVGLFLSEGHDALLLRDMGRLLPSGHIIKDQVWLEAMGSIGLMDRFEVGLAVPVALTQGGDGAPSGYDVAGSVRGQRGAAIGDLRLDGKVLLFDRTKSARRASLALVVGVTAPTSSKALAGEANATGRPRLVFEAGTLHFHLVATLGAIFRARSELLDLDVTNQVTFGLGGRIDVWRGLEVLAEVRGAANVSLPRGVKLGNEDVPVELDLGVGWHTRFGLRALLSAGTGLDRGYGAPDFRFLVGARYTIPQPPREPPWSEQDPDHDGIVNLYDLCTLDAGPVENQGCPDSDLDSDSIVDRLDHCPERAGVAVNGGCPDYDTDGDNIPDRIDRCPKEAGGKQNQGCPALDTDGDGVPDTIDRCRDRPGVAANDGCPDIDSDGDGIVDRLDKCPFDAEVYNGVSDDDGCPDEGVALVELVSGQISLFEPIVFVGAGAGEKLTPRSVRVLSATAALLRNHPELVRVRVDGHTDDRGNAVDNLDLSLKRAREVRRWLSTEGKVDPSRLTAQGFGSDRPIVENTTPQNRARNRRVEITVLESK